MHLGQPYLPSPAWRRRLTTQADRRRRQLRALRTHLQPAEALNTRLGRVTELRAQLSAHQQESLHSFNHALAKIPAPALRNAALAPVLGIEHPAAALALLKHYQQTHRKLTPSLEALQTQLEEALSDATKTLAVEANTHRFPELTDWFKNHEASLVSFAGLAYSGECLADNLKHIPTSADAIKDENLDDHRWLLPLSKSAENQFDQDSSQINEVTSSLDGLKTHLGHHATVTRLIDDLKVRHQQQEHLEAALRQSTDRRLVDEYREQMAHYSAELRALKMHVTQITAHSAALRSALSSELNTVEKAADHFESQLSKQVSFNPRTAVMKHWERQQDGSMCEVPVTDKDGNPIKITPKEAKQILEQMSQQYATDGFASPYERSWWRKIRRRPEEYIERKNGDLTLCFSSVRAKREFFERAANFQKQNHRQNHERFNDTAANAHQVMDPVASARALTPK